MGTPTALDGRYAGSGSADGVSVRTTFVVAPRAISALLVMALLGAACRPSAEPPAPVDVPTAAPSAPVAPARTIAGSHPGRGETCAPYRTAEPAHPDRKRLLDWRQRHAREQAMLAFTALDTSPCFIVHPKPDPPGLPPGLIDVPLGPSEASPPAPAPAP